MSFYSSYQQCKSPFSRNEFSNWLLIAAQAISKYVECRKKWMNWRPESNIELDGELDTNCTRWYKRTVIYSLKCKWRLCHYEDKKTSGWSCDAFSNVITDIISAMSGVNNVKMNICIFCTVWRRFLGFFLCVIINNFICLENMVRHFVLCPSHIVLLLLFNWISPAELFP